MTESDDSKAWAALGRAVGYVFTIMALFALIPLNGLVLQYLWAWFVTPISGVAAPSIALCVGLCIVARFILPASEEPERKNITSAMLWFGIAKGFGVTLLAWGAGWLVHLFV